MANVKTIGTGAGLNVTPDFASIALYNSYLNGLGAWSADQVGRILWASSANELTANGDANLITGSTYNGKTLTLEAGDANGNAGGSFVNNAGAASNPVRYDASKGAAIRSTTFGRTLDCADVTDGLIIRNLQFRGDNSSTGLKLYNSAVQNMENCIVEANNPSSGYFEMIGSLAGNGAGQAYYKNCTFVVNVSTGAQAGTMHGVILQIGNIQLINCVVANMGGVTKAGTRGINVSNYATPTVINTAVVGFPNDIGGTLTGLTGSNVATDIASGSSGFNGKTTSNQYSIAGTTEWTSLTAGSYDLRLKSASVACKNNGTTGVTVPATDIVGQSRSGTVDIGVWEYQATATGTSGARAASMDRRRGRRAKTFLQRNPKE